jgi:predicted transcriptional regulator YheO
MPIPVILTTIGKALLPYLVEMVVNVIKAEDDPVLDTGLKKHDHVIHKLADSIKGDSNITSNFENRDIMDATNLQIKEIVHGLNEKGIFKKGAVCQTTKAKIEGQNTPGTATE